MYQNIIFDLYGTLVDIRTDEESKAFWKKFSRYMRKIGVHYYWKDMKKAYAEVIRRQLKCKTFYEYQEIEIRETFRILCLWKGKVFDEEQIEKIAQMFRKMSTCYVRLYPDTEECLIKLKEAGKKLYLLSNAQHVFTMPEIYMLGLEKYFDGILLSSDCGCKKPDKTFMEKLLKTYEIDIKDSIMVGNDVGADVGVAKAVGMDSAYMHTNISPQLKQIPDSTYVSERGMLSELLQNLIL